MNLIRKPRINWDVKESFAERQALAEQSARPEERARVEQEMRSAHYIQKSLLPEGAPTIHGLEIQARYRSAHAVGGDLYDFLELPDGRIGIVIDDATGKGVPDKVFEMQARGMPLGLMPEEEYAEGEVTLGVVLLLVRIPYNLQ